MSLKGQSQENRRSWEMSEEFITINSKCNWKNSNKRKFFKNKTEKTFSQRPRVEVFSFDFPKV